MARFRRMRGRGRFRRRGRRRFSGRRRRRSIRPLRVGVRM